MDPEPVYPEDAPVGAPPEDVKVRDTERPSAGEDAESGESSRTRTIVAGAAIGIGSAALVAALLYANRTRKGDKSRP